MLMLTINLCVLFGIGNTQAPTYVPLGTSQVVYSSNQGYYSTINANLVAGIYPGAKYVFEIDHNSGSVLHTPVEVVISDVTYDLELSNATFVGDPKPVPIVNCQCVSPDFATAFNILYDYFGTPQHVYAYNYTKNGVAVRDCFPLAAYYRAIIPFYPQNDFSVRIVRGVSMSIGVMMIYGNKTTGAVWNGLDTLYLDNGLLTLTLTGFKSPSKTDVMNLKGAKIIEKISDPGKYKVTFDSSIDNPPVFKQFGSSRVVGGKHFLDMDGIDKHIDFKLDSCSSKLVSVRTGHTSTHQYYFDNYQPLEYYGNVWDNTRSFKDVLSNKIIGLADAHGYAVYISDCIAYNGGGDPTDFIYETNPSDPGSSCIRSCSNPNPITCQSTFFYVCMKKVKGMCLVQTKYGQTKFNVIDSTAYNITSFGLIFNNQLTNFTVDASGSAYPNYFPRNTIQIDGGSGLNSIMTLGGTLTNITFKAQEALSPKILDATVKGLTLYVKIINGNSNTGSVLISANRATLFAARAVVISNSEQVFEFKLLEDIGNEVEMLISACWMDTCDSRVVRYDSTYRNMVDGVVGYVEGVSVGGYTIRNWFDPDTYTGVLGIWLRWIRDTLAIAIPVVVAGATVSFLIGLNVTSLIAFVAARIPLVEGVLKAIIGSTFTKTLALPLFRFLGYCNIFYLTYILVIAALQLVKYVFNKGKGTLSIGGIFKPLKKAGKSLINGVKTVKKLKKLKKKVKKASAEGLNEEYYKQKLAEIKERGYAKVKKDAKAQKNAKNTFVKKPTPAQGQVNPKNDVKPKH